MNTNSSLVTGDAISPLLNSCSFSAVSGKKPLARLLISLILRKSLKISFEPLVKALTIVFSLLQAEGGCAGDDGCPGVVEPGGVWWTDTLDVIHLTGTSTRCEDRIAAVMVAGQRTRRRQCDEKNMCWRATRREVECEVEVEPKFKSEKWRTERTLGRPKRRICVTM